MIENNKKKFKKVYIEITNVCNLNCDFCPKNKRKQKFLTIPEFMNIMEEVSPYTNYVYLHLMGEPLLHDKLKEFIEIAAQKDVKVNLTTNGSLLNEKMDFLFELPALRQINISLHSFEANKQKRELEDYIENVMGFIKRASKHSNLICSVRLWNMDFEEIKGANTLNGRILQLIEEELELKESLEEKLRIHQGCKVGPNIYVNMAQKFDWPDIVTETRQEKVFCYGLRDQIGILVDGTVVPCCLDSEGTIKLGNIFEQSLRDILASSRAQNIYDGFSSRVAVEELCKRCGYAARFYR